MRRCGVAARFEDVGEGNDVALHIGARIFEAVADARLGREVNDPVEAMLGKARLDRLPIGEIGLDEVVLDALAHRQRVELAQPRQLQVAVVIVVDDVEADNAVAAFDQPAGGAEADEAGIAGDEDLHQNRPSVASAG